MELRIERPQSGYQGQTAGAVIGSVLGLIFLVGGLFFIIKTGEKNKPAAINNSADEQIVWQDDLNLNKSNPDQSSGNKPQVVDKLQMAIIQQGQGGRETKSGDKLGVHYTGWLLDNTKFDSSYDRGESFTFTLGAGQVINGWDHGLKGMTIGEKRRLIIPPDLAYGDKGNSSIPPQSTLIFEVELIDIE